MTSRSKAQGRTAQGTKSLVQWLIEQIDGEAYRAGRLSGKKHFQVDAKLLASVGGLEELLLQARKIEKDPVLGSAGKIEFQWRDLNADIAKIHVSVDVMPELCEKEGIEDPRSRQIRYIDVLNGWKEEAEGMKESWLTDYYNAEIARLEKGKCSLTQMENIEDGYLYQCLNELLCLEEPVEKPIFSARVLKNANFPEENLTPSKVFRKKYESKVISVLKEYSPEYEEGMSDDELLAAHGILSYTQTLEWKGSLAYVLDGDLRVDTSNQRYGTILGTQTLEHAVPESLSGVKKVYIIENKANFEKMKFRKEELYIFCHGFFSPKEVRFLKKIRDVADEGTEFYHWGDLDYGGIRIFQFNKTNVFPELMPYKMVRKDYEEAMRSGAGVPIADAKKEKLEKLNAGELSELKKCILDYGFEIEQELLV